MASVVYNEFKRASAAGEIDLNAGATTIKARLVMSNTTCDTENDGKAFLADFTTIDVCDSAGYVDGELSTKAINKDDPNDRAEFAADNETWAALAVCTRQIVGVLIYKFVTADADSVPIAYLEFAAPKTPDGSDFTVQWDAQGILQLA